MRKHHKIIDPQTHKPIPAEDFYKKYGPNSRINRGNPAPFMVIGDLKPFQHVAGDGVKYEKDENGRITDVKFPVMNGRRDHREYLKRNGLEEAGTELDTFMKYGGKTRENYEANKMEEGPDCDFRYEEFDLS